MSKFNIHQKRENIYQMCTKWKVHNLQCVNNHYAKFEYKEMKTVGVTDYTNQAPSKHFWMEKCQVQHPSKSRKYS